MIRITLKGKKSVQHTSNKICWSRQFHTIKTYNKEQYNITWTMHGKPYHVTFKIKHGKQCNEHAFSPYY